MLILNPFTAFLEDFRGAGRYGLAHRLTGQTFGLSKELTELLRDYGEDLSFLQGAPGSEKALEVLSELRFLVPSADPESLLAPFLGHRLVRPWMNPAITFRDGGQTHLVRLRDTHRCLLPRTPVPPEVVVEPVPEAAAALLSLADGAPTLAEALRSFSRGEVWEALDFLSHPERQAVRLAPPGTDLEDPRTPLHWLQQSFFAAELSPSSTAETAGTGRPFYEQDIDDAQWNFDWVEPTVSHAFRFPTLAFDGRAYGERLCEALLGARRGPVPAVLKILEIGGGVGFFARAFLGRAKSLLGGEIDYTILDCSPALQERQRRTLSEAGHSARFILGNAEELSFPGERFDLIVANEVIADFTVAEEDGGAWGHRGIFGLLDRLAAHLAPGGLACLTEYGDLETAPSRVEHLNHPEYSIHFGSLMEHAERRGLAPTLSALADLLSVRSEVEMLAGQQERILCLRHLLGRYGQKVPYAAFCRHGFTERYGDLASRLEIGGLAFPPLARGLYFGPALGQFQALLLQPC